MEEPGPTHFTSPSHFQKNLEDPNSDVNFIVPDLEHSPAQIKKEPLDNDDDDIKPKLLSFEENGALVFRNKEVNFLSHHSSCENTETALNSNALQENFKSDVEFIIPDTDVLPTPILHIKKEPYDAGVDPPDSHYVAPQLLQIETESLNEDDINPRLLSFEENGVLTPREEENMLCQQNSESETALNPNKELLCLEQYAAVDKLCQNKQDVGISEEEANCSICGTPLASTDKCLEHGSKESNSISHHIQNNPEKTTVAQCKNCKRRPMDDSCGKGLNDAHLSKTNSTADGNVDKFGKLFENQTTVEQHVCPLCGLKFTQLFFLNRHKADHAMGIQPHICSICGITFKFLYLLQNHQITHTLNTGPALTVNKVSYLKNHPITPPNTGPVLSANKVSYLKKQKPKETEVKPYACPDCDISFRTKSDLRYHKLTHIKVGPYSCPVCGIIFSHSFYLERHKITHTSLAKARQYTCTVAKRHTCCVCDKAFIVASDLEKHKLTHMLVESPNS